MSPEEKATIRSHKSILQHALNIGLERVFIFEDDIDFCPDFISKITACINELPEDWHGLHLAGYTKDSRMLQRYSPNLSRCYQSWGGYGYVVNKSAFQRLIDAIGEERFPVDTYYIKLMPELNWFKANEMLVYHLPGYSDIQKREVDYKFLRK